MKVSTSLQQVNNNLTEAKRLRQEKEKQRQKEAEYQRQLYKNLMDEMILYIEGGEDVTALKLEIIRNKYETIEKAATVIYNEKEEKEVINRTNDNKITDTILVNKYNKNYLEISDDLTKIFYNVLNDLLKDESEKEKAEKKENQKALFNYIDFLLKIDGVGNLYNNYMALQREEMKKTIASDLKIPYNFDYIVTYNRILKKLYNNYKTDSEIANTKSKEKAANLSIWWKLAAITSLLNKKR